MKQILLSLLTTVILLNMPAPVHGQVLIAWGTVEPLTTDTNVATNGLAFDAINSAQGSVFTATAVNGVTFNGLSTVSTSGNSTTGSDGIISLTSDGGNFLGNEGFVGDGTASDAYKYVINNASDANNGSVTIGSATLKLHPGYTYQVQAFGFWSGPYAATINGDPSATFPAYGGGYVIGTFTAAADTETFTYGGADTLSGHAGFVNDVSVRLIATPEPSTYALMLGGLMSLALMGRLRRSSSQK
jgi:hypothetical protein